MFNISIIDKRLKCLQSMADQVKYDIDRDSIYRKICEYITACDFDENPAWIDIDRLLERVIYRIYLWNKWERITSGK